MPKVNSTRFGPLVLSPGVIRRSNFGIVYLTLLERQLMSGPQREVMTSHYVRIMLLFPSVSIPIEESPRSKSLSFSRLGSERP